VESGVMLFAPIGVGGGAIKINPPLAITKEALSEGLEVVSDAVKAFCTGFGPTAPEAIDPKLGGSDDTELD
jgi:hypothetical protein